METMTIQKIIDEEIASIKSSAKPVHVHLVKVEIGLYRGVLPFEIKGDYILNSKNLNDIPVTVSYSNNHVEVEIDCDENEVNAFLSKDEATLLKAVKKSLKCDSFMEVPTFIVGPPGTGKTKVITKIMEEAVKVGKKILVASPTNMAVENVFERIDTKALNLKDDEIVLTVKTEDENLKMFSKENITKRKLQPLEDEIEILAMAKEELLKTKKETQPLLELHRGSKDAMLTIVTEQKHELKKEKLLLKEYEQEAKDIRNRVNALSSNVLIKNVAQMFMSKKLLEFEQQLQDIDVKISEKSEKTSQIQKKIDIAQGDADEVLKKLQEVQEEYAEACDSISAISNKLKSLKKDIDRLKSDNIYKDVKIVGATLVHAILNQKIQKAEFDMIIVDEASMALVPFLIAAAQALNTKKLKKQEFEYDSGFYEAQNKAVEMAINSKIVFVGDPRQLPPIAKTYDMKQSIFSLYEIEDIFNGREFENAVFLDTNFRNHPQITRKASNLFYGGMLKSGKKDDGTPSLYVKTSSSKMVSSQGSFINYGNMKIVVSQIEMALKRGRRSIGIITPYKKQALLIEENVKDLREEYPDADVQAGTIHTFQGKEKDIIIYDLTYSPDGDYIPATYIGDIDSNVAKLLNVAMTRAESFFIVIGDVEGILNINNKNLFLKEWLREIASLNK